MLATLPTREKGKSRNWTVIVMATIIMILIGALSGLAGLYYYNVYLSQPSLVIMNQSSDSNLNQTQNTPSTVIPKTTKNSTNSQNNTKINKKTISRGITNNRTKI